MCTDTSSTMCWPEDRIDEQQRGASYGIAAKLLPSGLQLVGLKCSVDDTIIDRH